jgi:hypothetical protein
VKLVWIAERTLGDGMVQTVYSLEIYTPYCPRSALSISTCHPVTRHERKSTYSPNVDHSLIIKPYSSSPILTSAHFTSHTRIHIPIRSRKIKSHPGCHDPLSRDTTPTSRNGVSPSRLINLDRGFQGLLKFRTSCASEKKSEDERHQAGSHVVAALRSLFVFTLRDGWIDK